MPKKKPKSGPVKLRQEPPRLLGRSGGYVQDAKYALAADSRYTSDPDYPSENEHPPEPEAVDKDTEKWIRDEAKERDELRQRQPLHKELELIELKLRPQQKAELRRRIEGLKRSIHEKAA